MSISEATVRTIFFRAAVVVAALGLASLPVRAATPDSADVETYDWSAALISFDEQAGTAVFQARFEPYAEIEGLDDFADGDRLILVWSGRHWAGGIRDLARDPELQPETLSLPVEFVSTAHDDQYLNFRVPVPDDAMDTMVTMQEGLRVTGISPRMATRWGESIVSLRPYNDVD
jgi:hypothetical protein